jgi:dihydrodipicolinate synthase/N-acetylneuraminate lyase
VADGQAANGGHQAAARGDATTCVTLQAQITDRCTLHRHGHWLPALKAACAAIGSGNGLPSPPLPPVTEKERRTIGVILARHTLVSLEVVSPGRDTPRS